MARLEVMPVIGRRRKFSDAEKAKIVNEALTSGIPFSHTARKNSIAAPLLHRWMKLARAESKFSLLRVAPAQSSAETLTISPVSLRINHKSGVTVELPSGTPISFVLNLVSELGRQS